MQGFVWEHGSQGCVALRPMILEYPVYDGSGTGWDGTWALSHTVPYKGELVRDSMKVLGIPSDDM
jgi:hypothetical protein